MKLSKTSDNIKYNYLQHFRQFGLQCISLMYCSESKLEQEQTHTKNNVSRGIRKIAWEIILSQRSSYSIYLSSVRRLEKNCPKNQ